MISMPKNAGLDGLGRIILNVLDVGLGGMDCDVDRSARGIGCAARQQHLVADTSLSLFRWDELSLQFHSRAESKRRCGSRLRTARQLLVTCLHSLSASYPWALLNLVGPIVVLVYFDCAPPSFPSYVGRGIDASCV